MMPDNALALTGAPHRRIQNPQRKNSGPPHTPKVDAQGQVCRQAIGREVGRGYAELSGAAAESVDHRARKKERTRWKAVASGNLCERWQDARTNWVSGMYKGNTSCIPRLVHTTTQVYPFPPREWRGRNPFHPCSCGASVAGRV